MDLILEVFEMKLRPLEFAKFRLRDEFRLVVSDIEFSYEEPFDISLSSFIIAENRLDIDFNLDHLVIERKEDIFDMREYRMLTDMKFDNFDFNLNDDEEVK